MVFLDILRPGWKHSDPRVRKRAVTGIHYQALLKRIVDTDPDMGVREAALAKLTDWDYLDHTARTNSFPEIREMARALAPVQPATVADDAPSPGSGPALNTAGSPGVRRGRKTRLSKKQEQQAQDDQPGTIAALLAALLQGGLAVAFAVVGTLGWFWVGGTLLDALCNTWPVQGDGGFAWLLLIFCPLGGIIGMFLGIWSLGIWSGGGRPGQVGKRCAWSLTILLATSLAFGAFIFYLEKADARRGWEWNHRH